MVDVNLAFKREVMDILGHGDKLAMCEQCGKCNDVCPVSQRWGSRYNPRDIVLFGGLGFLDALVAATVKDPFILWGCAGCETCDELCPAEIPITHIINNLKNKATSLGVVPQYYIDSNTMILETSMSIPPQDAIERRREQMGIGASPSVPKDEVNTILKELKLDQLMAKARGEN